MNENKIQEMEIKENTKKQHPNFNVGDTLAVSNIVREGNKKRTQIFKGVVLAIKGSGIRKTFTIRKISMGIGVEKILPLYSPNVSNIKIIKKGQVRKSKLYYMRKRIGKRALKVKEGIEIPGEETQEEMITPINLEVEVKKEKE